MARSKGRAGRPWRRLAASVRAQARNGAPCCLCGHPIDLTIAHPHPMSFSVEHHTPLSRNGAPRDPSNVGPAHLGCNSRRGNRDPAPTRTATSRAW